MKRFFFSALHHIKYHSETVIAIPVSILSLLAIAFAVRLATGDSLTEDITSVASYGIKGVGFLIAAGLAIAIKSRGFGDVDEKTCSWQILLIDSLSLWITLLLALLAVFGSTLWL